MGVRQQRRARVVQFAVEHRVQQRMQHFPNRRAGKPERLHIVAIYRQLPQRQACILREHGGEPPLGLQQQTDVLRMGVLPDRIALFDRQQVAEAGFADLCQTAAHQLVVIAQRAVVLLDQQQDARRLFV